MFDAYLLREPDDQNAAVSRASILFWAGKNEEAAEAAEQLRIGDDLGGLALFNLAVLFWRLEKPQLFLSLLRRAINNGYRVIEQVRNLVTEIKINPDQSRELQLILKEFDELIQREKGA